MTQYINKTVEGIIHANASDVDIGKDDDLFSVGISSLTVVNMQVEIEQKLGTVVQTKELMKNPSISGWIALYSAAAPELKQA